MTTRKPPRLDLNPSSADRWTTCTASPRFIMENWDKVPVSSDTVYNQEGTTAHAVAAAELNGQTLIEATLPTPVDADMRWHGWNYAEYVSALRQPGSTLLVETKLPLWYMKERNCVIDAAVVNSDSLHVVDYKYGEGIPVSPVGNIQAAIYAITIGQMGQPLPTEFPIFIHIYQPRGRAAEDGASHVWQTTWLELNHLVQSVDEAALVIQADDPAQKFSPSEKACQWCPAKGFCNHRRDSMTEGLEIIDAQPRPLPSPAVLRDEQIQKLLVHKSGIISWLEDVEEWAQQRLVEGHKIPGFKLVLSRGGNRYWSDPKKAAVLLLESTVLKRDEVIEEKVIGPAAVEKLLGKNKLNVDLTNLITRNAGSPVIARDDDRREAIGGVLDDFEILPE